MHVQLSRENLTSDWIIRVVGRYLLVGVDNSTSLPQRDCGKMHSGHGEILVLLFGASLRVNLSGTLFQ